jgi:hypothetical protein
MTSATRLLAQALATARTERGLPIAPAMAE